MAEPQFSMPSNSYGGWLLRAETVRPISPRNFRDGKEVAEIMGNITGSTGPVRGNDPSDPKDPFLGLLMDPDRLKRLNGTFGTSGYQDCFIAPPRTAYSPRENPQAGGYKPFESNPPYDNDRTPRLVSEQRAQYGWPTFYVQEPNMKYRYKSEIGPIMNPPGAQTGF